MREQSAEEVMYCIVCIHFVSLRLCLVEYVNEQEIIRALQYFNKCNLYKEHFEHY